MRAGRPGMRSIPSTTSFMAASLSVTDYPKSAEQQRRCAPAPDALMTDQLTIVMTARNAAATVERAVRSSR